MREPKRAPETPAATTEAGLAPGARMPRGRRPLLLALLAAVTVAGALAAAGGPARAQARPVTMPCTAAGTAPSPRTAVRPCPPPPCQVTPVASPAGRMSPRPAPCPVPRGTVVLTERDSGRTVTVHAGTRIDVQLSGGGVWSEPASSHGTVVTRVAAGHDARGTAHARFRAAGAGGADLTATDAPRCAPMCKVLVRLWVVHIVVVA
jgi:hypothetical protein